VRAEGLGHHVSGFVDVLGVELLETCQRQMPGGRRRVHDCLRGVGLTVGWAVPRKPSKICVKRLFNGRRALKTVLAG
jgi:hypothetical protein